MTDFLASVSTLSEASLAEKLGADVIDLKDPNRGALGAIPEDEITKIVAGLGTNNLISATIGDLALQPEIIIPAIRNTAQTGVDFIKIGIFEIDHFSHCIEALTTEIKRTNPALIGVLFADRSFSPDLVEALAKCGFRGIMLDTANKSSGSLTSFLSEKTIRSFITKARSYNLICGLAGSLRLKDINTLVKLKPDYLGFRGALCKQNQRIASLDMDNFRAIRGRIDTANGLIH